MKQLTLAFFALTTLGWISTSCRNAPAVPQSHLDTVAFAQHLWDKNSLNTCWEFTSDETAEFRTEFTQKVTAAFADAVVNFAGWGPCHDAENPDVRLFIYDEDEANLPVGYQSIVDRLVSENGGEFIGVGHPRFQRFPHTTAEDPAAFVVLNRTFRNAAPGFAELAAQFTPQGARNLSLSASIHELGHTLGLRHEDAHPDRSCDSYGEDLAGDTIISDYNPFSFMSRCYYRMFNYNLGIILPNQRDIAGINKLYENLAPDAINR